jgi:hypothetical protein
VALDVGGILEGIEVKWMGKGNTIRVVVGIQIAKHFLDYFGFILLEIYDSSLSFL